MTKWKEQFDKEFSSVEDRYILSQKWQECGLEEVKSFISTEISERLIDDIPDSEFLNENVMGEIDLTTLKQKLRDKYLN